MEETTPLIIAIEKGNIEIVRALLSYPEIDVNICKILLILFWHSL